MHDTPPRWPDKALPLKENFNLLEALPAAISVMLPLLAAFPIKLDVVPDPL
jgi:hypothetical protein